MKQKLKELAQKLKHIAISIGKKMKPIAIGIGKIYLSMILFSLRMALIVLCIFVPIGCLFGSIPGWVFWVELVAVIVACFYFRLRKA